MRRIFSDLYTKDQLQQMWLNMTQKEISKETGFSTKQIYRYTKKWNLQKRVSCRLLIWDVLLANTEFLNYFGGFCYADGSLSNTQTSIILRLSVAIKDSYLLEILHTKIEGSKLYNYTDAVGKPMISLSLYGLDLPKKLKRFGITQEKRYVWTEPSITDDIIQKSTP